MWANRAGLEHTSAVEALDALRESAETATQAVMLRTVAVNLLRPASPPPDSRPPPAPTSSSSPPM